MLQNDNPLWVERYRPRTVADTILPEQLKAVFQEFVDRKSVPNLLLSGGPGIGKTTVAKAMLDELGCDYIVINGSLNGNIDTLRNDIMQFASTVSLQGDRKYVILDEADYLNANSTQPALRNFMEEYSKNCGFILTCNFKNRIIEPLHSRCSVVEFKITKEDKAKLAAAFHKRCLSILKQEDIEADAAVVAQVIKKYFPDWRRVLNELQRYSVTGRIDSGILSNFQETNIKQLVGFLKEKNFSAVRTWIAENNDMDHNEFYRTLYDTAASFLSPESIPMLVLIIGKYQYQAAFCANQDINTAACLIEVMMECKFK